MGKCFCLGEIVGQVGTVRFKDVDDIADSRDIPYDEKVRVKALDSS